MAKPVSIDVPTGGRIVVWGIRPIGEVNRPKPPSAVTPPTAPAHKLLDGRGHGIIEAGQHPRVPKLLLNIVANWPRRRIRPPNGNFLFHPLPQAIHSDSSLLGGECAAQHAESPLDKAFDV